MILVYFHITIKLSDIFNSLWASLWYPHCSFIYSRLKYCCMAKIQDIKKVIEASNPNQWEHFEQVAPQVSVTSTPNTICYVYTEDVNICLERGSKAVEDFDEPWVPGAGGQTDSYVWWLTYQNSPVEKFAVVSVDGGRANIPVPDGGQQDGGTPTLTEREANLGRIFDQHALNGFDDYIDRSDVEIV